MRLSVLFLTLLIGCLAHLPVLAAEANSTDAATGSSSDQASQDSDGAAVDQAGSAPDQADDAAAEEEEESPSRFIPTEQISQDLGVSFPVDI